MSVELITVHPEYICNKPRNDIAIIQVEKIITWSEGVRPACLPTSFGEVGYERFDSKLATVAGWGWTNENSNKGRTKKNV